MTVPLKKENYALLYDLALSLSYPSVEGGDLLLTHGGDYLPSRQHQEGAGGSTLWVCQRPTQL